MALFDTLKQILTPYANKINLHSEEIEEIQGDVSEVKADLTDVNNKMFPVEPVSTTFFENLNYGAPQNVTFYNDRYINASGKIITAANTCSIVFNAKPNTTYFLYVPSRNRQIIGETASDFVVESTYAVLTTTQVLQYNGIYVLKFTTGATTKKVIAYVYSGSYDYEANKNDIIITETDWNPNVQPTIIDTYIPKREIVVTPRETAFFDGVNYFSVDTTIYYTDRFLNIADGQIKASVAGGNISFKCEPSTEYYIYIPNNNRGVIGESTDGVFSIGTTLNLLYSSGMSTTPYHVTTSADAKYIFVYFYSGSYDYEANKGNIVINKNSYVGNIPPFIAPEHLPSNLKNALLGKNVLIFGDSITDTCNFTINSSNETTAMTWKNPSNSYVNAGGQTIKYNMWPKMLKDMGICAEVRNYARQGASFKDATRPSGEERQNVSYQITVALNDLSNPHDVFDVDDFTPDIVIFALGTNDGIPNDTYASAMEKTILKSDGYSIDTGATLANLDMSKFCEATRSAFLRTRIAFPYAQFFCVLPIQRANNEINGGDLSTYLSRMAKRYGCVIIDGFAESGIIRDANNWNTLGETLKDGLHPNDKGQNMLFRAIYGSLISHYVDLEVMNP